MKMSEMQDFQAMREMFDCLGIQSELQAEILEVINVNFDSWTEMQLEHRLAALGSTMELFNPLSLRNHTVNLRNAKTYLEELIQISAH